MDLSKMISRLSPKKRKAEQAEKAEKAREELKANAEKARPPMTACTRIRIRSSSTAAAAKAASRPS